MSKLELAAFCRAFESILSPSPLYPSLSPYSSLPLSFSFFLSSFLSSSLPLFLSSSLPLSLSPSLPLFSLPSARYSQEFAVVPVCALSLARGSAPLRRPRTATQGTRDCHEFTVTCAWMPRKNTRHVCSPHATARRAAAGVPGTGGPRSLSRAPPARSRGLRLRSPSCASRSAAPIVPDALRRRMAEPAAGGRDAVQLRQLARAQRGGAAGAAARRPVAQLEREYRTIIVSR